MLEDHLGSTRLAMQGSSVLARYDYLPFGEHIGSGINGRSSLYGPTGSMVITGQDQIVEEQFTGKERDAESGLDYFGARFFMAPAGRFLSPDAPFADQFVADPQSWNLYSYTRNNPLRYVDSNGRLVKEAVAVAVESSSSTASIVLAPIVAPLAIIGYLSSPGNLGAPTLDLSKVPGAEGFVGPTAPSASSGNPDDPSFVGPPAPKQRSPKRTGRGRNKTDPDPKAEGPHSVPKRDANGNVTGYTTFGPTDPRNPNPFQEEKRFDGSGAGHLNKKTNERVETPHVHDPATPGGVRPPRPDEIPRRREE